jgi:hypothetical protein
VRESIRCVASLLLVAVPAFVPMTACKGRRGPVAVPPPPQQGPSTAPPPGAAATSLPAAVTMLASASEVAVGERVYLRLMIQDAKDVGSVPFYVTFDPAVLRFESSRQGPFLGSDGRETVFLARATSAGDTVVVGSSRLGAGNGINGTGELCVLEFTAVGPGTAKIAFANEKVRDSSNRIVPGVFRAASVTVR